MMTIIVFSRICFTSFAENMCTTRTEKTRTLEGILLRLS